MIRNNRWGFHFAMVLNVNVHLIIWPSSMIPFANKKAHVDSLVQDYCISSALTKEILQSCTHSHRYHVHSSCSCGDKVSCEFCYRYMLDVYVLNEATPGLAVYSFNIHISLITNISCHPHIFLSYKRAVCVFYTVRGRFIKIESN